MWRIRLLRLVVPVTGVGPLCVQYLISLLRSNLTEGPRSSGHAIEVVQPEAAHKIHSQTREPNKNLSSTPHVVVKGSCCQPGARRINMYTGYGSGVTLQENLVGHGNPDTG